jgi:hypothetical protein
MRVNDIEAPEKPTHMQKLTNPGRTVNSVSRTKFANGNPGSLKPTFNRTFPFEAADRYVVSRGGQPPSQLHGLGFCTTHVEGINEMKYPTQDLAGRSLIARNLHLHRARILQSHEIPE